MQLFDILYLDNFEALLHWNVHNNHTIFVFFIRILYSIDQPMVDDLRKLCLSKEDFNVLNTIGRGHFGQVRWFVFVLKSNPPRSFCYF